MGMENVGVLVYVNNITEWDTLFGNLSPRGFA
jgi:hypothetical protein